MSEFRPRIGRHSRAKGFCPCLALEACRTSRDPQCTPRLTRRARLSSRLICQTVLRDPRTFHSNAFRTRRRHHAKKEEKTRCTSRNCTSPPLPLPGRVGGAAACCAATDTGYCARHSMYLKSVSKMGGYEHRTIFDGSLRPIGKPTLNRIWQFCRRALRPPACVLDRRWGAGLR